MGRFNKVNSAIALMSALIMATPSAMSAEIATTESSAPRTTTSAPIDFTKAAEATINRVVSIKSFATPRQSRMSEFNDPFSDQTSADASNNNHRRNQSHSH
jgi:hypothetical protein